MPVNKLRKDLVVSTDANNNGAEQLPGGTSSTPMKNIHPLVTLSGGGGAGVDSFEGRSGVVVAQSGDYTASEVTNVPAGTIAATTVQAAINELDTDKQADIQFQDEGVNQGSVGGVTVVNYVGAGVEASESGGVLTVTISGGGSIEETVSITNGQVGSNLEVTATATGTTASYAANKYTIDFNGALPISADLLIVAADVQASADGAGVTNWVQVQFDGLFQNDNNANPKLPSVQKIAFPAAGALTVSNAASVDNDNSPALAWVGLGTQSATLRVGGITPTAQGYLLKFTF